MSVAIPSLLATGALVIGTSTTVEELVVTAGRIPQLSFDVPAPVTVISRREIDLNASHTIDGLIRTIPSVATFRRSSSLVADPTSQGLNLRGVGPSGVSRTLVLLDGVPVHDPFGGWIYWRALPRLGIDRIEVAPGGGSALWGSHALGGVVQLISREIEGEELDADASYGSFQTIFAGARAAGRTDGIAGAIEGELLTSEGHPVVAESSRGAIDGEAPSWHGTLNARVDAQATQDLELTGRMGWFREDQNGGTELTTAEVEMLSFGAGAHLETGAGRLSLNAYGGVGELEQTRARITQDRSAESIAAEQRVPSREVGGSLTFTAAPISFGGEHVLLAGVDVRRAIGDSHETIHLPSGQTLQRDTGGVQQFVGTFVQDLYSITAELDLVASLRFDGWNSRDTSFEWSPRLGLAYRPWSWIALRAAGYRAFRAPTLNELHRPFQVGTIRTAANEELESEHLLGAEAGIDLLPLRGLTLRTTGFWNRLDDPILNVTLAEPLPDGSQRRRENVGRARILGVESSVELALAVRWSASLSYSYVHATIVDHPASPELVGKDLPQDPRHRGSATLSFDDPKLFGAAIQVRAVGPQYEDDQNELAMGGFALIDLFVDVPISGGFEIFAAVENVLDQEYLVGRAGIDTIGQPRMIRAGVRLR